MDRMLLDQLAGEALRELLHAVQGTLFCRSTAERLRRSVEPLLPLVQGLAPHTQRSAGELGELAARVREALDLARRAATSPRWNVYRAAQLSRWMEATDRGIARWLERHTPAHVIAACAGSASIPVAPPPPPHKGVPMPMEAPLAKAAFAAVPMEVPPHKGMAMSVPMPVQVDRPRLPRAESAAGCSSRADYAGSTGRGGPSPRAGRALHRLPRAAPHAPWFLVRVLRRP